MQTINSSQGRWSVTICSCSQETIHVIYGNATLHILVEDLRDLGMAMQKMAEGLRPLSGANNASKKKELLQ